MTVYVSEFQWVIVGWDKDTKELEICTPPEIEYHRKNSPIKRTWLNWRVVGEKIPVKVSVDEYFKRTRVM
jgi:hypothetical protein